MTDPRILTVISFVFALLTAYSLYTGLRQLRDARRAGHPRRWYSDLSLLTGIEYGLLTFVFLLRTASVQGLIAPGLRGLVGTLYLLLLIPAAIIAALVIRRVLLNLRNFRRAKSTVVTAAQSQEGPAEPLLSKEERESRARRQRERRKKAAAARRRQSGKA